MKRLSKLVVIPVSLLAVACVQEPAKVEYHLNDFYGYVEDGNTDKKPQDKFNLKRTHQADYNIDGYQAPSEIAVETIDNNLTPKLDDDQTVEITSSQAEEKQVKTQINNQLVKVSGASHTVKKGETLYAISREYNIPILSIILANKLVSPYILNEGQRVKVPDANFHIVGTGDTLYGLSRKYNVDLPSIVKLNKIDAPYSLYSGQKVQIPFPTSSKSVEKKAYAKLTEEKKEVVDNSAFITESGPRPKKPLGLAIDVAPTNKPQEFKANDIEVAVATAFKDDGKKVKYKKKKVSSARKKEAIRKIVKTKYKDDGKFIWPVKGKLVGNFGKQKNNEYNDGIYIGAPNGKQVLASLSGRVVYTGDSLKSYGNLVIIKHDNGLLSAYAHLQNIKVKKDQQVRKGDEIGTVGQTGKVDNPQLYFAIRKGKEARNPLKYLK